MQMLRLAWMLGRPRGAGRAPLLLTASAYAMVSALMLLVLGGALSFTRFAPEVQGTYVSLAGFALVLLMVPLLVLGAAAVKLSARAQDRALSSMRLLGAGTGQIAAVAVLQAAGAAVAGALAGVVLYFAAAPLVSQLRFQGEPIGSGIYLAWWVYPLAVLAVGLLAAGSAAAGLRKLVITPLAVATRRAAPVPKTVRAVITVAGFAVLYLVFNNISAVAQDFFAIIMVIIVGFGLGLLVLNLIGPWLVALVGRRKLAGAQSPAQLLAARMILENPAASWRQVSGVAMASFVAVVGGSGAALMQLGGSEKTGDWFDYVPADVFTGVLVTLAVSFVCVAASAAITQTAGTLDNRELYAGLNRLGMDYSVMNAARSKSLMIPALTAAIGFAVASAVLVAPLAGLSIILKPLSVLLIISAVVLGLVLVRLAIMVAEPKRLLANN